MWPYGRLISPESPGRLDCPLAWPAPLSRTRLRAWVWHCRNTSAGSPRCLCPPPCPAVGSSAPQPVPHPLVAAAGSVRLFFSGGGGFLSSSCPLPSSPIIPSPLVGTPEVLSPPGQLFHSGGVNALRQLDSPSHSLMVPSGVFCHSGGLAAPSLPPTSEDSPAGFSASRQNLPLPWFSPHGCLPLPPRPRAWRRPPRCCPCRTLCPQVAVPLRFVVIPAPSPYVSRLPPPVPLRSQPPPQYPIPPCLRHFT